MRCILCSSNGGEPCSRELSYEAIIDFIDQAVEIGCTHVNISGGEPFLHPDLIDICGYIKQKSCTLDVYTSGNTFFNGKIKPLDEYDLKQINEIGINKIVFSIHGDSAKIHESITLQKESYNNLIKSIKSSKNQGIFTELHFVPNKINYMSLPNVIELFESLHVDKISILRFVSQGRGKKNRNQLEMNQREMIEFRKILLTIRKKYLENKLRIGTPFNCLHVDPRKQCTAGLNKATIKSDGFMVPCVSMKDFSSIGDDNDLFIHTIKDVWKNSSIFKNTRNALKNKCTSISCENIDCNGGCLTQSIINDWNGDPLCQLYIQKESIHNLQEGSVNEKFKVELCC